MSAVAASLFPDLDGHWFASWRSDPRAAALYRRHYSAEKNARAGIRDLNFMGPGECLILLTGDCRALFAWQRNVGAPRLDGQEGVCCTVFRNEGPVLSSDLIREAQEIAWRRWPGERLFTYVWDAKVATSKQRGRATAGWCFRKAGWRTCGRNADGRLTILEIFPTALSQQEQEAHTAQRPDMAAHAEPSIEAGPGSERRSGPGSAART